MSDFYAASVLHMMDINNSDWGGIAGGDRERVGTYVFWDWSHSLAATISFDNVSCGEAALVGLNSKKKETWEIS